MENFEEMLTLSARGDNTKVDLTVGDIYGRCAHPAVCVRTAAYVRVFAPALLPHATQRLLKSGPQRTDHRIIVREDDDDAIARWSAFPGGRGRVAAEDGLQQHCADRLSQRYARRHRAHLFRRSPIPPLFFFPLFCITTT
jgi:hypothetical protein